MAGMVGVALFYGDAMITPAISVLSAVEGLKVAEIPIDYDDRIGESKLEPFADGLRFVGIMLDTVLVYNQTYVPNGSWLIPQTVLTARTAKITMQYDF